MKHTKPPLPFMGNKKNFYKPMIECINLWLLQGRINKDTLVLDVFGGSGFLSHNIKQTFPFLRVLWNDYENYQERLDHIESTEALRKKIVLCAEGYKAKDKLSEQAKQDILKIIKEHTGFVDYITLSTWLLFSLNYAFNYEEFSKVKTFYNRLALAPLDKQGYLEGVERESLHYKDLLEKYTGNVLLVLDPPYAYATLEGYTEKGWSLLDFLQLTRYIHSPCMLFSHKSSCAKEILCFLGYEDLPVNVYLHTTAVVGKNARYEDYLLVN